MKTRAAFGLGAIRATIAAMTGFAVSLIFLLYVTGSGLHVLWEVFLWGWNSLPVV